MPSYPAWDMVLRVVKQSPPPEIWREIIFHSTFIPGALNVDPWDPLEPDDLDRRIKASLTTRRTLPLVSRQFHAISNDFLFEVVSITNVEQLKALFTGWEEPTIGFRYPHFKSMLQRRTRRVDVTLNPLVQSQISTDPTSVIKLATWIVECIAFLIQSCPSITHFSHRLVMPIEPNLSAAPIFRAFTQGARTPLQVLDWGYFPAVEVRLPELLSVSQDLRILRFSSQAEVFWSTEDMPVQMRYLHTLWGEPHIIIPAFITVALPSLVSLDLGLHWSTLSRARIEEADTVKFFMQHKDKIERTVCGPYQSLLRHCANLQSIVIDIADVPKLDGRLPRVNRLGLCSTEMQIRHGVFREALGDLIKPPEADDNKFPSLKVVRVLDSCIWEELHAAKFVQTWINGLNGKGIIVESEVGSVMSLENATALIANCNDKVVI